MLLLRWEARILRLTHKHPLRIRWLTTVRPALAGPRGALMASWNRRLGGSIVQRLADVHHKLGVQFEVPAAVEPLGARPNPPLAAGPSLTLCPTPKGDHAAARAWASAQVEAALSDPSAAVAFADGACTRAQLGAGAFWLQLSGQVRHLRVSLFGPGAEPLGMELFALCMCLRHYWQLCCAVPAAAGGGPARTLHLFADSLIALQWLSGAQRPKAYTTMFNELLRLMQACMDAGHSLRLVWVPGHAAVPQLSTVDRLAKVASRRHTLRSALGEECAEFLPISFLVARRLIAAACFAHWTASWQSLDGAGALRALKPSPAPAPEHWSGPRARDRSLLLLRHGCCLSAYLFRIAISSSPMCPHGCGVEETPAHFLLECRAYDGPRAALRAAVRKCCSRNPPLSLPLLLGASAPPVARPPIADAVASFVELCGRALLIAPSRC